MGIETVALYVPQDFDEQLQLLFFRTETQSCIVRTEPMTYIIILIEGTIFVILYIFVATMNKKMGMKYLLSKYLLYSL